MRLASDSRSRVTSTNVCQCGSFVPQRVNVVTAGNFGQLDNPTPDRVVRSEGVRGAGARHAGHRGPQHRAWTRHAADQPVAEQALSDQPRPASEFRAEIFNLLNHNNFGNPDANISNATAGDHHHWPTTAAPRNSVLRLAW